jgi:hypothetical protein
MFILFLIIVYAPNNSFPFESIFQETDFRLLRGEGLDGGELTIGEDFCFEMCSLIASSPNLRAVSPLSGLLGGRTPLDSDLGCHSFLHFLR